MEMEYVQQPGGWMESTLFVVLSGFNWGFYNGGSLIAVSVADGEVLWSVGADVSGVDGSTAPTFKAVLGHPSGEIVYTTITSQLRAYNAHDGSLLWTYEALMATINPLKLTDSGASITIGSVKDGVFLQEATLDAISGEVIGCSCADADDDDCSCTASCTWWAC